MWTNGQRTKTNPKTSPEQSAIFQLVQEINKTNSSITRKTAPPPWQPYMYKTNLFTKFHDDRAKNVTSRVHVIQLTKTIFQLNSPIKETNVLTKFHENWAKNVTTRVFTCFHYIHIEKNAPPTGGHVFSPIWIIFDLVRHINKTNFTRKTAPPTGGHLHEDWALNVTSTHDPFHEDRTINVASRVFMNKCGRTDDGQRPVTKAQLSKQETKVLTKFHENWAKNVTSSGLTCFHYINIEKNAPPTGRHVFSPIWTIFELQKMKTALPTGGHTNILTNFKLDRDFIRTKLLTKFHEDRTINVVSRVFTNKCLTDRRTNVRRTKTGHKSSLEQSGRQTDRQTKNNTHHSIRGHKNARHMDAQGLTGY
ncbi:hypothetical protein DPMN_101495 [Dreissena polymorpha]|uniref:Uncharacterized protein n=1 Tax=Dreissena polymorpha TaxID=45954 RepID=A0A9D4R8D1_DREPO|nr:hypothetical protein DPMN_101495 [Dreissena polymorpha]